MFGYRATGSENRATLPGNLSNIAIAHLHLLPDIQTEIIEPVIHETEGISFSCLQKNKDVLSVFKFPLRVMSVDFIHSLEFPALKSWKIQTYPPKATRHTLCRLLSRKSITPKP